jgi:hypothetical protein
VDGPSTGTPCGAAHPPLAGTIGCAVTMALEPAGAEQPRRWRFGISSAQPAWRPSLTVTDDDALNLHDEIHAHMRSDRRYLHRDYLIFRAT